MHHPHLPPSVIKQVSAPQREPARHGRAPGRWLLSRAVPPWGGGAWGGKLGTACLADEGSNGHQL